MKKELFNRIIAMIQETMQVHKHTIGEGFESYSFQTYDGSDHIELLKSEMKSGTEHQKIAYLLRGNPTKTYLTVLYNEIKDKISVGNFDTGWFFAARKNRYYPSQKNRPVICYSKNLYVFHHKTLKPRLMTTNSHNMWGIEGKIMKMMTGLTYEPKLTVPVKYALNTHNDWEILYNKTGVRVPKSLHKFKVEEVLTLIQGLRNINELSMLCMYVAKPGCTVVKDRDWGTFKDGAETPMIWDLWSTLSFMMMKDTHSGWLIRDWFNDHVKLGRKASLKVSSKTRLEDEHRKMSREIMVQGCREIKVHECYKEMFKSFPIEGSELIEDKKRLMKESIELDHCVATYHPYINNGDSCIISVPYNGRQWTLQVNRVEVGDKQYDYRAQQFRGYRNEDAPTELCDMIQKHFESIRIPHTQLKRKEEMVDVLPF